MNSKSKSKKEFVYSVLDTHETDLGTLHSIEYFGGKTGRAKLLDVASGKKEGFSIKQRSRAVYLLGLLKWGGAKKTILELLNCEEQTIRINAMYALAHTGNGTTAQVFLDICKNKKIPVIDRAHAIVILGEIGNSKVSDKLKKLHSKEQDISLKNEMIQAIESIKKREMESIPASGSPI